MKRPHHTDTTHRINSSLMGLTGAGALRGAVSHGRPVLWRQGAGPRDPGHAGRRSQHHV